MNKPYQKNYENGILTNPIKKEFLNHFPSRSVRRKKEPRIFNNRKTSGVKVVSIGRGLFYKFVTVIQHEIDKTTGSYKRIVHHREL